MNSRASQLNRSNLYMLPTQHGLIFALVLLAMLLIAVNYANTLAYIMTFLLVSLVLVSMLFTHRNLSGIEVSTGRCMKAFAGSSLNYQVCLQNHSDRQRHDVGIDIDGEQGQRLNLQPGELVCIPCEVNTVRRGWVMLPAVQVNTRYPLGIMFSWSRAYQEGRKCLVYPKPGPLLPFPPGTGGEVSDNLLTQAAGHDDFAGLRVYREGDALQHVDWKAYARGKGMHTKEFAAGQTPQLEFSMQHLQGDIESRISLITRWVIEANSLGARFELSLPGKKIPPDTGNQHMEHCLRELALL